MFRRTSPRPLRRTVGNTVGLTTRFSGSYTMNTRAKMPCPVLAHARHTRERQPRSTLPRKRYRLREGRKVQTPMAQDRSTKTISMIEWIWTSRLSKKKSLSGKRACNPADSLAHRGKARPDATLKPTQGQIDGFFSQLLFKCRQSRVASVGD